MQIIAFGCINMDEIEKLFEQYNGSIIKTDEGVEIKNINIIQGKKVLCSVSCEHLRHPIYKYTIHAEEKTYEIIGGLGLPCETIKSCLSALPDILKKWCFTKKEHIQMNLFDFTF